MGTVSAARLLDVWSVRLKMDIDRQTWKPSLRASVESLLQRLRPLEPAAAVYIDADENRHTIVRFVLVETGEILGQIDKPEVSAANQSENKVNRKDAKAPR